MALPSVAPISATDPLIRRLWQSGRELFHSNVIAYLLQDQALSGCLLQTLTGDGGWHNYEVRVLREWRKFDLTIIARKKSTGLSAPDTDVCSQGKEAVKIAFADWRIVVVENKFKSLPDRGQLMRYTHKLDGMFRGRLPVEGCSGTRSAGLRQLCELWCDDSLETNGGEDDSSGELDEEAEDLPTEGEASKRVRLNNYTRVDGILYTEHGSFLRYCEGLEIQCK